ncbi:MAG: hypothetical protein AB9880_10340 [Christensenellales bacterium]
MMKKCLRAFFFVIVMLAALPPAGRAETSAPFREGIDMDSEGFLASLGDWILGTDYGILSGRVDGESQTLSFLLPEAALARLSEGDRADIQAAMLDLLSLYLPSRVAAERFSLLYQTDGAESGGEPAAPAARENLVFIHHSVGENWLRQGLCEALNLGGYHVADITYGWREYGDHTDTLDWPLWFREPVMDLVYRELGAMSAENSLAPAPGENDIILFKSCFPNSDVGEAISDEQALYKGLLPYFRSRPDKLFILVTPPPMIRIPTPGLTRQLCHWLTDRNGGWLAGLETGNVFVFDLYTVLTHPDAHHRLEDGLEVRREGKGAGGLYYDSDGDDHPNEAGSRKATEEFLPLLDHWYALFEAGTGDSSQRFLP